ncbi:FAD-dependent oxidoreductase [Agilicoccus flavus]|uniref:FAD-dependent oxidoreductase n=1 Tax=Agilicoccus flavus TaxID=2775968 RepID=UPI001CF63483|nr:NAD(P)/FAD-dependent oxidoreductase [Agilicoccus flavus]
MVSPRARVCIAGAGLAGATLACALDERWDVTLVDPSAGPGDTSGYRIHLTTPAVDVLSATLPPRLWRELRGAGEDERALRTFAVLDARLRARIVLPVDDGPALLVARPRLREVLAQEAGAVRWGTRVTAWAADGDGVTVSFSDGRSDRFDLLVAADGTGSSVARPLRGGATCRPVDVVAIAGTAGVDVDAVAGWGGPRAASPLLTGPAFALGPDGLGAFLTLDRSRPDRPELLWSIAAAPRHFGADLRGATGAELRTEAVRRLRGWAAPLRDLVAASDPDGVASFPFWAPSEDWVRSAGRVAVLGDAVHPMPATGGVGGSTAIRDAGGLARALRETESLPEAVPEAVERAYAEMLGYAPAAVAESLAPLTWQRRLRGRVPTAATLGAVSLAGRAAALLRRS